MAHGYKKWEFTVRDQNDLVVEDGCAYAICTAGTSDYGTIYADGKGTAKTNPVAYTTFSTDNAVRFWTATSISTVDVHLWSRYGGTTSVYNWGDEHKTIRCDNSNGVKMAIVPIYCASSVAATSVDTTFDFPYGAIPMDVTLFVQSASPGSGTLTVGLATTESGGDVDGFLVGVTTATAGYVANMATFITGSAVCNTALTTDTLGLLLHSAVLTAALGGACWLPRKTIIESGAARSLVASWDIADSHLTAQLRVQYEFAPLPRLNVY